MGRLKTLYVLAGGLLFALSILYVIPMIPILALIGIALAPTSGAIMSYGLWWGKPRPNISA
jgi:hypothetical protein